MYAVTSNSYRSVSANDTLSAGETLVATVPIQVLNEVAKNEARAKRNELLRQSDWTQMGDAKVTGTEKALWQTYRQALRDITSSSTWPLVQWPVAPSLSLESLDKLPKQVID